jgi:hypothetical protein
MAKGQRQRVPNPHQPDFAGSNGKPAAAPVTFDARAEKEQPTTQRVEARLRFSNMVCAFARGSSATTRKPPVVSPRKPWVPVRCPLAIGLLVFAAAYFWMLRRLRRASTQQRYQFTGCLIKGLCEKILWQFVCR